MPPRNPLPEKTAITYEAVIETIEAYLAAPATPKEMRKRFEVACLMDHAAFSHRMTKYRGELFRLEHFGAMAREAGIPHPWPFVSREEATAFQAFRSLFEKANR